jgi:hypothetical protein
LTDRRADGWTAKQTDRKTNVCEGRKTDRWADQQMGRQTNRSIDRQAYGWAEKQTDRQTRRINRQTYGCRHKIDGQPDR